MIAVLLWSLPLVPLAALAAWLLRRRALWLRVSVAAAICVLPALGLATWVLIVGDKAAPDAITIVPAKKG